MMRGTNPRPSRPTRLRRARSARLVPLACVAILILLGQALGVLNAAPPARAEAAVPIDRALGATRSVEEVLGSHLADGCYLGTPYGTIAPGRFGDFSTIDRWDCRYPNGRPKPGVGGYMNCAGFVSAVLTECGADVSPIANHISASGYRRGNDTNASKWKCYVSEKGFVAGKFATKEQMLASGLLKRGDIIYIHPVDFSGSNDCHMGFFWGSRSNEDLFWHSAFHGNGIVAGSYPGNMISRITPKSPASYYLVIKTRHDVDISFTKVSADASFTDGNSEYTLAGAEYDIFRAEDEAVVGHIVTDAAGHASLALSPGARYYAIETKAPAGFELDRERRYFTATDGQGVILPEDPGRVLFKIVKRDATGKIQTGADLSGATYRLVDARGIAQKKTTDAAGRIAFDPVPLGVVSVTETRAPAGYRLDTRVRTYHITAAEVSAEGEAIVEPKDDFVEIPLAFDLEIAKFKGADDARSDADGHEQPAAGVVFEVVSKTSGAVIGSITTGADGFVDTSSDPDLWFGQGTRVAGVGGAIPYDRSGYTVREVAASVPVGFDRVGEWSIGPEQMLEGIKLRYILNDARITSRLQIVKIDAETGSVVALAGFSFQILDVCGKVITMIDPYPNPVERDAFTTDASGCVSLPERLPSGSYHICEIAAAPPYLVDETEIAFEIPGDFEDAEPVVVVRFPDSQAMGHATITKICDDADGGDDDRGSRFDAGCDGTLQDAEFDVRAVHDVVSPDGRVRAEQGEIVDHVTTGEDGTATTKPLYLGTGSAVYAFIETRSPAGHVLDDTPHEVTLSYEDARTPVVGAGTEADDAPSQSIIEKTDRDGTALSGATFELWSAEDEIDVEAEPETGSIAVRAPRSGRIALRASGDSVDGEQSEIADTIVELAPDKEKDCWVATGVIPNDYEIISGGSTDHGAAMSDEEGAGSSAGDVRIRAGQVSYGSLEGSAYESLPVLLRGGAQPDSLVSDETGRIFIGHLPAGCYRVAETAAPTGYLVDVEPRSFTVDERGLTEGRPVWTVRIADDFTRLDISKRDITDERELPGAHLSILNEDGEIVASWISGDEPHRIERLKPGGYTLVETMTPHSHDQAAEVPFTVEPRGEIQHVVMYDEPIDIAGRVDVRQEIARPTANGLRPDGDGRNRADPCTRDMGRYAVSIDFCSVSNTWVDEFTLDCPLDSAAAGATELEGVITPQAQGDCDGEMNVWFTTSAPTDEADARAANATRSDGHVNPWLEGGGRAIDYSGWRLWAADVATDTATELNASDLGLADGERVTGVRFEYGRVEPGFATRSGGWDRDDLKAPHDDLNVIEREHEGDSFEVEGERRARAAAVLNMRAGDSYAEGVALDAAAKLDMYRNGGGEDLEAHDKDWVTQTPGTVIVPLAQTGRASSAFALSALGATAASAVGLIGLRCRSGRYSRGGPFSRGGPRDRRARRRRGISAPRRGPRPGCRWRSTRKRCARLEP